MPTEPASTWLCRSGDVIRSLRRPYGRCIHSARWDAPRHLALRHDQQAAKLVDLAGQAQRLRLQHAYSDALVALLDQIADPLIEGGQLGK